MQSGTAPLHLQRAGRRLQQTQLLWSDSSQGFLWTGSHSRGVRGERILLSTLLSWRAQFVSNPLCCDVEYRSTPHCKLSLMHGTCTALNDFFLCNVIRLCKRNTEQQMELHVVFISLWNSSLTPSLWTFLWRASLSRAGKLFH